MLFLKWTLCVSERCSYVNSSSSRMGCGASSLPEESLLGSHKASPLRNYANNIQITISPSEMEEKETGDLFRVPFNVSDTAILARLTDESKSRSEEGDNGHERNVGIDSNEDELMASLERHIPFEDEGEFPVESALGPSLASESITWVRPHDTSTNPRLYVDGTSRTDVVQGSLGDCWLLSTAATLAKRGDLIRKVVPEDQTLNPEEATYNGVVRVRLWHFGKWVQIFVDDRLPYRDGHSYIFAKSLSPDEFWIAMLEKAFAKMYGSYEAIEGGMPLEAMIDLTGGIAERYELKKGNISQIYKYMRCSFKHQSFITCSRIGEWRASNIPDKNGLIRGHAYTITGTYTILYREKKIYLLRIRNPWADENEWKGDWSDGDAKWDEIPVETKKSIGLHKRNDGEFWMDYFQDFLNEFTDVTICTLSPDFDNDGTPDSSVCSKIVYGEWIPGVNSGGCRNDLSSFASNPQFILHIKEPDTDDETSQVIIGLSQKYQRSTKSKLTQIAFVVYRGNSDEPGRRLDLAHFSFHYDVGSSGTYINYRDVFKRFELSVGYYVIIPATFEPGIMRQFMIRVFAEQNFDLRQI